MEVIILILAIVFQNSQRTAGKNATSFLIMWITLLPSSKIFYPDLH